MMILTSAKTDPADIYVAPAHVTSLDECHFYRAMDVPGHGTIPGLRGRVSDYLGNFARTRRWCRIGHADLSRRSAGEPRSSRSTFRKIMIGISSPSSATITPPPGRIVVPICAGSTTDTDYATGPMVPARMVHDVAYDIPAAIGPVDVAIFGSILLHLRDPFLALENSARLAREAMIVADLSPYNRLASRLRKIPKLVPRGLKPNGINDGWCRLPPLLVKEYLAILGFTRSTVTWNGFQHGNRIVPIYTIVAYR